MFFNPFTITIVILVIIFAVIVVFLRVKKIKPEGKLKKYLILTAASLAGFFIFALLHNLISGGLSYLLKRDIEEPVFFILATILCPLGLIVGITGSIAELIKLKRKS